MTIDEFLEKHNMTAYRLGEITRIPHSQISRYRSGAVPLAPHYAMFLDVLSYALEHGFEPQGLVDGRTARFAKK